VIARAQPQLCRAEDDESDEKQDQPQLDQRGCVDVAVGLRELVGERRGDGISGRQERPGQVVGVADHEGHGHGFTQSAPESEKYGAGDAFSSVRDDHVAHHLPGGAAETVARFFQGLRRHQPGRKQSGFQG